MAGKRGVAVLAVMLIISIGVPLAIVLARLSYPLELSDLFNALGRAVGLIAFFIFTFQYVWTAKIKLFESIRSYDGRVAAHRSLGFLGVSLLIFHPIFVLVAFGLIGIPLIITLPMALGFIAFVLLIFIAASTFLSRIWGVRYRVWKRIHLLTFPVLTIAFFHSIRLGSDMYGPVRVLWFALWISHLLIMLAKLTNGIKNRRRGLTEIVDVRQETADTTSITTKRPPGNFIPGQFAFISLKHEGKWSGWHPFSATSLPDDDHMSFTIKRVGPTTSLVPELASGGEIRVDPGYGAFSHRLLPDDRYVMIAGGVGITPIYSMLKDLASREDPGKVVLIACVHHEDGILFRDDLDRWFSEKPGWESHIVCSRQKDWPGPKGRLDPAMLLELLDNDLSGTFFLCGPTGLVGTIRRFLLKTGLPGRRIRREEFVFLP